MQRRCVIVFMALITAACGPDSVTGPSATTVTFSGRVLDFQTDAPIAGATVVYTLEPFTPSATRGSATTAGDGRYSVTLPNPGSYTIVLNDSIAGQGFVTGPAYRGDLYAPSGNCISRYGLIINKPFLRPLPDATVQLTSSRAVTGANGWYRLDLGCPNVVLPGGTTIITSDHRNFERAARVVGRGVMGIRRLDIDMTPR